MGDSSETDNSALINESSSLGVPLPYNTSVGVSYSGDYSLNIDYSVSPNYSAGTADITITVTWYKKSFFSWAFQLFSNGPTFDTDVEEEKIKTKTHTFTVECTCDEVN